MTIDLTQAPREKFRAGEFYGGTERAPKTPPLTTPENGRCCWCWELITAKRRRTWCGQDCIDEYQELRDIYDPVAMRSAVFQRDRGVCAACGLDTEKLKEQFFPRLPKVVWNETYYSSDEMALVQVGKAARVVQEFLNRLADFEDAIRFRGQLYLQHPWAKGRLSNQHLWEADHIVSVVEGGGACPLSGYQTLCLACHRKKSGELAGRLARKPKKTYRRFAK